jgi:hypothetical protein
MAPESPLAMTMVGLVGLGGFEPPTSPLSGVRSNQLSYRPGFVVESTGPALAGTEKQVT